jgi:hypothetical protein
MVDRKRTGSYLVPLERIEGAILKIRGERVMLGRDLAAIYGVSTKALNQAVKRNRDRFPEDFVFELSPEEKEELVTNCDRFVRLKYSSTMPNAFTEHGAVMLASVLKSKRAAEVSVFVVRAFIRMRRLLADQQKQALKLAELESKLGVHDRNFRQVFAAIRQLMEPPRRKRSRIGFRSGKEK